MTMVVRRTLVLLREAPERKGCREAKNEGDGGGIHLHSGEAKRIESLLRKEDTLTLTHLLRQGVSLRRSGEAGLVSCNSSLL